MLSRYGMAGKVGMSRSFGENTIRRIQHAEHSHMEGRDRKTGEETRPDLG